MNCYFPLHTLWHEKPTLWDSVQIPAIRYGTQPFLSLGESTFRLLRKYIDLSPTYNIPNVVCFYNKKLHGINKLYELYDRKNDGD